jgi:hypothetical protein
MRSRSLGVPFRTEMSCSVLLSSSAMVQVPAPQIAQFSPDVAAVAADGELTVELLLTLAAWAVRAGELIEVRAEVAAWEVAGMRKTRSIAEVTSPRHRGIERRIASHLPEGISSRMSAQR